MILRNLSEYFPNIFRKFVFSISSRKKHLKYTKSKIAKSIGLMYKAKPFLDKDSLFRLQLSYIHSDINFANLAWESTHKTNLKKIRSQQKHALAILYNEDEYHYTKDLLTSCSVLNIYKLILSNTSIFIPKMKTGIVPPGFHTISRMPSYSYPTPYASVDYIKPKTILCKSRFPLSTKGLAM